MDISKDLTEKSFDYKQELQAEIEKALSGRNIETDEPQGFQTEGVYFGQTPPRMNASQYLEASIGWVYGCVSRIADALASVDIELYKVNSKGDVEEVPNHPAIDLLDRVNDYTTRIDHMNLTQQYLELAGEAPWYVNRGESGNLEPSTIMLLRPDRLTIVQNDDKTSDSPIKGYSYKVDAQNTIEIKPEELIFLKYPDPTNWFRGKGTLAAAARTVDIDNFSEEYNKRFFYNSARPDMVLSSDQKLTLSQRQTLQSSIKKLYQGGDKSHKTLILESGLTATPFSVSAKDMDFLEQQRYDMAKIFSIFGVPKSVMAISDDVNFANAKVGEYVFMKYTIVPKLKRIVAQLNEFYLPMFKGTEGMFFSFDNPIPSDTDADVKRYDSALGKGYMTINEVRHEQNLPDIGESGDTILVPMGITPIDNAIANPQPAPIPSKAITIKSKKNKKTIMANSGGGYSFAFKQIRVEKAKKKAKEKIAEKITAAEKRIDEISIALVTQIVNRKKFEKKQQTEQRKRMVDNYVAVYLSASKNFERVFQLGMNTVFEEQKKRILAKVPKKSTKATVNIDDWSLDEEDETKIMVNVFTPLSKEVIKANGERAAKLVGEGTNFSMATDVVQNYLKDRTFKFSFEVNQETNRLLGDTLKEGVKNGEGIPQLRARVSELFTDMESYRSERIARTEVISASNFAANEAYNQSGVVNQVQWLATEDDRIDDECAELDGNIIDLGDSFANNEYFGDVEYPPVHANCRCTVIPIVS